MPRSHLKTNFFQPTRSLLLPEVLPEKISSNLIGFLPAEGRQCAWQYSACTPKIKTKKFPVKIKLQKFFMIWISKSWILEFWRWMKFILLGIYFDIISNSNNPSSKHLIEQSTFKNYKWNFFSFDITKVAWLFFLPS